MKLFFYFHGFNSAPSENPKTIALRKFAEENGYKFAQPRIDYRNLRSTIYLISKFIKIAETFQNHEDVVLCGTSMGAFVAALIGKETNFDVVAINPAFEPHKTTKKYVGNLKNYVSGEEYVWTEENSNSLNDFRLDFKQHRTLVLGDFGDDVIPFKDVVNFLRSNKAQVKLHYYDGGSHRFDHIEEAIPMIKEFIEYRVA